MLVSRGWMGLAVLVSLASSGLASGGCAASGSARVATADAETTASAEGTIDSDDSAAREAREATPGAASEPSPTTTDRVSDEGGFDESAEANDDDGENGDGDEEDDGEYREPSFADPAREALRSGEAADNHLGLRFLVLQQGADLPWLLVIANESENEVDLAGDLRVLELEVKPFLDEEEAKKLSPWRRKKAEEPKTCRLPASDFPSKAPNRAWLRLAPGQMAAHPFDPRLFCTDEELLEPRATVTPRFGWEPKTKVFWKGGKKVEEVLVDQKAPFIARRAQPGRKPDEGDATDDEIKPLKQLTAPSFELDDSYAPVEPFEEKLPDPPPLELEVKPLDSTTDPSNSTVTVVVKNPAKESRRVFLRRELITYEVTGPRGRVSCQSGPDDRAPDKLEFIRISAGGSTQLTSRLAEMCPPYAFPTSGIYRVHARLDAREDGRRHEIQAFTGIVTTKRPALFRVRGGRPPRLFVLPIHPSLTEREN